jgi:hypothetical protein
MAYLTGVGATITILNSRISGSSTARKGSVAYVAAEGGALRIAGSTITDSADGSFAVYDASGTDFSVQVREGSAARNVRVNSSISFVV